MNTYQTKLFTMGVQIINRFANGFSNRTHCNNNIISIGRTVIRKWMVFSARDFGNLLHVILNHIRNSIIKLVASLPCLEENIRILGSTSRYRMFRICLLYTSDAADALLCVAL